MRRHRSPWHPFSPARRWLAACAIGALSALTACGSAPGIPNQASSAAAGSDASLPSSPAPATASPVPTPSPSATPKAPSIEEAFRDFKATLKTMKTFSLRAEVTTSEGDSVEEIVLKNAQDPTADVYLETSVTPAGGSAAGASPRTFLRVGGKGFRQLSREALAKVLKSQPDLLTDRLPQQFVEVPPGQETDTLAASAYSYFKAIDSSLSLGESDDPDGKEAAGKAEVFEGRPVFTYKQSETTLRITQEKPYRLVSVSQDKASADGTRIKLIYFSEEGKLTHPLTVPSADEMAPDKVRQLYREWIAQGNVDDH